MASVCAFEPGEFAVFPSIARDIGEGRVTLQVFAALGLGPSAKLIFPAFDIAIIGQSGLQQPPKSAAWAQEGTANNGTTPSKSTTSEATNLEQYFTRPSHDAENEPAPDVIRNHQPFGCCIEAASACHYTGSNSKCAAISSGMLGDACFDLRVQIADPPTLSMVAVFHWDFRGSSYRLKTQRLSARISQCGRITVCTRSHDPRNAAKNSVLIVTPFRMALPGGCFNLSGIPPIVSGLSMRIV